MKILTIEIFRLYGIIGGTAINMNIDKKSYYVAIGGHTNTRPAPIMPA